MAAYNPRISGYTCVQRVLRTIGLPVPVSAAGATDAVSVQIWSLLTELGQELMELFDWQMRTKTLVITTAPGVLTYALPDDLVRLVDSTGWNMTAQIPMIGPMTSQQWALLKARELGGTDLRLQYRVNDGKIELYYSPSEPATLNFQYISRGWVQDASDPMIFKDTVEADGDIVLFEPRLIVAMLRFRWRQAKGFETSALEREFKQALEVAKNNDTPADDLRMSYGSQFPYLGYFNMPDTGYGQS